MARPTKAASKVGGQQQRPQVTGVTLHLAYPNGSTKTITIDPKRVEAIFWSERAVKEILAPFYEQNEKVTTHEELGFRFGVKRIKGHTARDGTVKITPDLVAKLWDTKGDDGSFVAYITKTIKCIPNGG